MDRKRARSKRKPKPLPDKLGSMQVFAQGFTDASIFLQAHPWPGRLPSDTLEDATKHRKRGLKLFGMLHELCGKSEDIDDDESEQGDDESVHIEERKTRFVWTDALMDDFRKQLEKLVVLDYLMRNTDRGACYLRVLF